MARDPAALEQRATPQELSAVGDDLPASDVPAAPPANPFLDSVLQRIQRSDWKKQIERATEPRRRARSS